VVSTHRGRINSDPRRVTGAPTSEMFHSANLSAFLALGLLAKRVATAPAPTARSDASVSISPRIIALPALLNTLEVVWGSCESFGVNSTGPTNLKCAYFEVPMDYHDSSAGNARLAVIKLAATGKKLGTVFFNPGSSPHPPLVTFHQYQTFYRWTRRLRNPSLVNASSGI